MRSTWPMIRGLRSLVVFFSQGPCLLALISLAFLGESCELGPSVDESPSNASILQGWNHTFWCRGTGSSITVEWQIDSVLVYKLSEDSKILVVDVKLFNGSCFLESALILHAESVPEDNTLSTFAIQCLIKKKDQIYPLIFESYLNIHVIGRASDVELISSSSPKGPAIIQWIAPNVLSGSSSPLYYNITVRDPSNQVIAQNTTTDTSFAIDSDLLVPCHSYELTLLPFQQIFGHPELGIMTQETLLPPPLPPINVNLSVSVQHNSALATIHFQVQLTTCSLQWPENFIVMVMQDGTDTSETFQSAEQTVMGMENVYTLEKLDLRQKYQVSIKLGTHISSSIAEIANFSTFNVQNLTLMEQEGGNGLNVHCEMAKGAEDKNCTVMMRNETAVLLQNCFPTGGRDATCTLSGLALGKYMIQGYDQQWEETPAVEYSFLFSKETSEDSTNTVQTTSTDETTTFESSPSRSNDAEAVQNGLIIGIVAPMILILIIGLVSIIVAVVVMKFHSKKRKYLRDSEPAPPKVHVYHTAEENEYDEHNIPQQQDTPTESTVVQEPAYAEAQTSIRGNLSDENSLPWQQSAVNESTCTDVQEPAYADAQTVISTTPTTNNSHNQYREHRKEWLAYLPHTTSLNNTPDGVSS